MKKTHHSVNYRITFQLTSKKGCLTKAAPQDSLN
uniref:Uncharacterized protein n=1 Tax=Anguilla anguilla TaxID=7936 RepID=A0A0E9PCE8_ANGAN